MRDTAVVLDDAVARGRRIGVALSDDELRRIAEHLGRVPTDTELFAFDAQWSEHCSYKSSRDHLRKLPTQGPTVLLGVGEDAGVVRLGEWQGETYGIVVAHESHNHPSQVVPFEGAATGIGGIVRDVLCMGAEVIGVADPLRFGRLENEHCRYVAQQVVDGIAAYGNAIGVPNVGGDVFFDASFDDNVLVNVVALGLVKEKDIIHSRAPQGSLGWDIVLVGKATDRSGFGGASFSSLTLDEDDADQNKGAVQVPDPFLKNVIMRASYAVFAELRAQGIIAGFKDLGAGGLAGCSAELCAAGGMGAEVELDRVSTGQRDLPPEVIAIGETQERLCWIVPPSFTPTLLALYNEMYSLPRVARGACAAVIGKVTQTGRYVARHHGEIVMDVDLEFLTGGVRYQRPYVLPTPASEPVEEREREVDAAARKRPASLLELLRSVLAHRDVCSRATIYRRYDGVVRGCTALPPGFADAGVLVPIPGAPLAVATGIGGNPRYGKLDPKRAAELAVVEAIANVTAVGATPAGLTDCLNFGDPTVPEQMGAFAAAVDGLADAARALDVPFVSGNVSLYNCSSSGNQVAPSSIVGCIGSLDDVAHTITPALKSARSALLVLTPPPPAPGEAQYKASLEALLAAPPDPFPNEDVYRKALAVRSVPQGFGGSVIAGVLGMPAKALPEIDYDWFARACRFVRDAARRGWVTAARDVSDGGALVAMAEMAFAAADRGAPIGFCIDLDVRSDFVAEDSHSVACDAIRQFDEAPGFVLEIPEAARDDVHGLLHEYGFFNAMAHFWTIPEPVVEVRSDDDELIECATLDELREAWEAPLRDFYGERRVSAGKVAVVVFPGTNSEAETLRAILAVGLDGELVHWSQPQRLARFDAFVLPGGFAYEDRIRAGAVAAHDAVMDPIVDAARAGKFVLGICNGAQVLAEAGLVPGTGRLRRPTAAFAPNASGRFQSVHVHVKLAVAPERVPIFAGIAADAVIPAWASHGDGRLAAPADELARIERDGHLAFVYCDRDGSPVAAPNGAALDCAGLVNREGNVLAIMPHPERDAWTYQHLGTSRDAARGDTRATLAPSGGITLFEHFARAVRGGVPA